MHSPSNSSSSQQPDNREWLTCPVCRKPARPLNPAPGQTLNRCPDCKVTFFDKGEFARNLGNGIEPQNFPKAFAPLEFKEQLECPRCAKTASSANPALSLTTPLSGYWVSGNQSTRIALCATCGGIAIPDNNIPAIKKFLEDSRSKMPPSAPQPGAQIISERSNDRSNSPFVQLLANAEALLVRQRFEGWELFTNFDARNKYEILDQNGRTVAHAAEQNKGFLGFLGRNILGQFRRIEIFVFDADRQLIARAILPFRLLFRRMDVVDAAGRNIGCLERRFSLTSTYYSVHDARGSEIMEMKRPWFRFWKFTVSVQGRELALVEKKWSGALRELFTNEDFFKVTFSRELIGNSNRMLVLLGALIVDLVHFEHKK
jgi:Zn-finger nucleic acid-binding protein